MSEADGAMAPLMSYMRTLFDLPALVSVYDAGDLMGLVAGAWRIGLPQAALEPVSVADLASAVGRPEEVVERLLESLAAYSVVERRDGTVQLAESWRPLALRGAPMPLDRAMRFTLARARMVEAAVVGDAGYWETSEEDRRTYAAGVSLDPESEQGPAMMEAITGLDPVLLEAMTADGARYLELGCGTAGALCSAMQAFPSLTAVGVELSDDLAEVARGRAERLGLTDRFTLVHGDVAELDQAALGGEGEFGLVFWSQFFFPEHAREAALARAHAALTPDGVFYAPVMAAPPSAGVSDDREARESAVDRFLHGSWGIPHRSAEELVEEVRAAGFADVEVVDRGVSLVVRARRG